MKNERGSMALTLLIIFVIGISITALTQLLLGEKITARDMAETSLSQVYEEDKIMEFTNNLVLQMVNEKKWDGEIADQSFVEKVDIYTIEDILNREIVAAENDQITVSLTNLVSEKVGTYCEETYEVVVNPSDTPQFLGYHCQKETTEFSFLLTVNNGSRSKSIHMSFQNIQPYVADSGESVRMNGSDLTIVARNK